MKKPNEVFLEYIEKYHKNDLMELKGPARLDVDYTLLNDYFVNSINLNFFDIDNYNNIILDVEKEINIKSIIFNSFHMSNHAFYRNI